MTKKEYMRQLAGKLRRLPKEDYDKALAYFDEYFEEAGPENEQQAITDLGSPEEAAKELIMQLAGQNSKEPPKTMKKGISAVWVGILGVCAAPIALPLRTCHYHCGSGFAHHCICCSAFSHFFCSGCCGRRNTEHIRRSDPLVPHIS